MTRRACRRVEAEAHAAVSRRFARLAVATVAVVAGTGIARALSELASPSQIWTTDYGRTLLAESMLFAVALGFGWLSRSLLRSHQPAAALAAQTRGAPKGVAELPPEDALSLGQRDGSLAAALAASARTARRSRPSSGLMAQPPMLERSRSIAGPPSRAASAATEGTHQRAAPSS